MREFRNTKGWTEHYNSLEELRAGWNLKPASKKRPKDEKALQEAREKFLGTCPCCKNTLSYIYGSSYKTCKNAECKGFKKVEKNEDGTERVCYIPYLSKPLDKHGKEIALNLFDEE